MASKLAQKVVGWLGGLFGMQILQDLAGFFSAFEPLWGGFKLRSEEVLSLLARADLAGFVVVTSATRETISEAIFFHEQLRAHGLPISGFIANRVHPDLLADVNGPLVAAAADPDAQDRLRAAARSALDHNAATVVDLALENLFQQQALARTDRQNLRRIEEIADRESLLMLRIEAQDSDVHDLIGLAKLEAELNKAPQKTSRGARAATDP
jgi:anion-transporting  ArsA/GET3 family ATPase